MSGVGGKPQGNPSKSSWPIALLPTPLAAASTHVHPVVLLAVYYAGFSALIADPVSTLSWALIPLAFVQIAYCTVCLPIAGTSTKVAKKTSRGKGVAVKKSSDELSLSLMVSHSIISLFLSTISVPLLFIIQVLLGAPITTHIPHTLLSSTHLVLLVVFPLVYVHGIGSSKWLEILSAQSPLDEVFGAAVGACIGALLGAVPIPLDWDREWQKWPITIVTGIYGGYVIGKGVGGWLVRGKTIEFD